MKMGISAVLLAGLVLAGVPAAYAAETLHLLVMSPVDPKQEEPKYEALGAYLRGANPLLGDVKLRIAKNYPEAARLFAAGDVEGMFSGSFVAAVLIAKGIARPVARPVAVSGASTYRTTVVTTAGGAPFAGLESLRGKRVAFCRLASAGDVFLRSLLAAGETPQSVFTQVPVDTHQAALEAVSGGAADYAVVKSTVFVPDRYPGLVGTAAEGGEHPDTTLIMPDEVYQKYGALVSRALLGLEGDASERGAALKRAFGCRGFVATSGADFVSTFLLLKKARVDPKTFDFSF
jgi:ABC-type phosphate/phosphonate transport system substrate-binding protein